MNDPEVSDMLVPDIVLVVCKVVVKCSSSEEERDLVFCQRIEYTQGYSGGIA